MIRLEKVELYSSDNQLGADNQQERLIMENFKYQEAPTPRGERPAHWRLYELRVDQQTLKEEGVKTPDGKYYPFQNGEKFVQISISEIPGERVSIIVEQDGHKRLFESWKMDQGN
mgnify:CR=1 FL=1